MQPTAHMSLKALTGARFLAALWVVAYHYIIEFRLTGLSSTVYGHHTPLDVLLLQGHLAVDFFFALSGFILAYTYATSQGSTRGGARAFWVARIARIYPVYVLGLILGIYPFVVGDSNPLDLLTALASHVFMLQAWIPPTQGLDQPSWSLSVETFFYLLFPLLLPIFARNRRRGLVALLIGSWIVFLIVSLGLTNLGDHYGLSLLPNWREIVRYAPIISLPEFTAGMAMGLLFVKYGPEAIRGMRNLRPLEFDLLTGVLVLSLLAILAFLFKDNIRSDVLDTSAAVTLPLLVALIFVLAFQRGLIATLLAHPLMVWLGEISYGVYILHDPLWRLFYAVAAQFQIAPGNPILIPIYGALLIAVAGVSFEFLERPLRRAIRSRWGESKRAPVPIPAPATPIRV